MNILTHLCIFIINSILIFMPLIFRFCIYTTSFKLHATASVILMALGIVLMMMHTLYFIIVETFRKIKSKK